MEFDLKWVHMARYELILKLDGALWLRIILKPLLTPKEAIKEKTKKVLKSAPNQPSERGGCLAFRPSGKSGASLTNDKVGERNQKQGATGLSKRKQGTFYMSQK